MENDVILHNDSATLSIAHAQKGRVMIVVLFVLVESLSSFLLLAPLSSF